MIVTIKFGAVSKTSEEIINPRFYRRLDGDQKVSACCLISSQLFLLAIYGLRLSTKKNH